MAGPTPRGSVVTTVATTTSQTTPSLSVSSGDILVGIGMINTGTGADITVSSSPTLTWTKQAANAATGGPGVWIYTAVASADGNVTFTVTPPSSIEMVAALTAFGNAYAVGPNTGSGSNGSGAPTCNLTTTGADSAIVAANGDWTGVSGTSRTWRTINANTPTAANSEEITYQLVGDAYYAAYWPDSGSIATVTPGLSAPSGQNYRIVAIEILAGPPPPPPPPANVVDMTKMYARTIR